MNQQEFKEKYNSLIPMYNAWGQFVCNKIRQEIQNSLPKSTSLNEILKIDPVYRVKTVDSLINKAFIRKKDKYEDAFEEITDKVGCRFVVLLTSQLTSIQHIVENSEDWSFSRDRDFEDERHDKPRIFDYQSIHYVVKARKDFSIGSNHIKCNTPCEIQLRTLLQHAYAELAHDTIYKNNVINKPDVHRLFAKSMALMETTDDLMCDAKKKLDIESQLNDKWKSTCIALYCHHFPDYSNIIDHRSIDFVLDELSPILNELDFSIVNKYITEGFIVDYIRKYLNGDEALLKQPYIFLVFYLIRHKKYLFKSKWPFEITVLSPVFSDLGIAL